MVERFCPSWGRIAIQLCIGYLCFLLASVVFMDNAQLEDVLLLCWMVVSLAQHIQLARAGWSLTRVLCVNTIVQLPGLVASVYSMWNIAQSVPGEWAPGALEMWIHPFLRTLELLPVTTVRELSVVYVTGCLVPFGVLLWSAGAWYVGRQFAGGARRWREPVQ